MNKKFLITAQLLSKKFLFNYIYFLIKTKVKDKYIKSIIIMLIKRKEKKEVNTK